MTETTTTNYQYLVTEKSDGAYVSPASGKLSLFAETGATPNTRRSGTSQASVTDDNTTIENGITNMTQAWGFATQLALTTFTGNLSEVVTLLNEIRACLDASTGIGALKGSA